MSHVPTLEDWAVYASLFLGLVSALVGGVFKGFSEFIMDALARTTPEGAIEAMQNINRSVMRTQFIAAFFALAPASIAFALYANGRLDGPGQSFIIVAAPVYLVFVFLLTALGNVPMNNRLARMPHASEDAAQYWSLYLRRWTWLNQIREIGCLVVAALYLLAAVSL